MRKNASNRYPVAFDYILLNIYSNDTAFVTIAC